VAALLGAVVQAGHDVVAARDLGLTPVAAVHDPGYLEFLATAHARWQATPWAGLPIRPQEQAVRHSARPPQAVVGQAGYYLAGQSAPILGGTWRAALGAAHAAVEAADAVLAGAPAAYALCRPPGHQAHVDLASGFCYLNNAAVAAQRLRSTAQARIVVLDIDAHHGAGTQQIFYARDDVHVVSVHADPANLHPFYSGYADETGQGTGRGWNLNIVLAPATGDRGFVAAVERATAAIVPGHPVALVVALGFDALAGDPTANLAVTAAGFGAAGAAVGALGLPTVLVQEGGAVVGHLAECLTAFLAGFATRYQAAAVTAGQAGAPAPLCQRQYVQAVRCERLDREIGVAVDHQIGDDRTDDRDKLEAMP
jgi:acetoin utilization deacetylase AcuC-like enzyme